MAAAANEIDREVASIPDTILFIVFSFERVIDVPCVETTGDAGEGSSPNAKLLICNVSPARAQRRGEAYNDLARVVSLLIETAG
jgi:hypothetical protein